MADPTPKRPHGSLRCGIGAVDSSLMARSLRHRRGGFVLLWVLSFNLLLLLMVFGYLPFFQTTLRTTSTTFARTQAQFLAELGIDEGLWSSNPRLQHLALQHIGKVAPWANPGQARADVNNSGAVTIADVIMALNAPWTGWTSTGLDSWQRTLSNLQAGDGSGAVIGTVTVTVTDTISSRPIIVATGTAKGDSRPVRVRALAWTNNQDFSYAIYGQDHVAAGVIGDSGTVIVDSYNSAQGAYGVGNQYNRGHIGGYEKTPPDAAIDVEISSGSTVKGNIYLTPGAQLQNNGILTGSVIQTRHETLPPIVIPTKLLSLPSEGALIVNVNTNLLINPLTNDCSHQYTRVQVKTGVKLTLLAGCEIYVTDTTSADNIEIWPGLGGGFAGGGTVIALGSNRIFTEGSLQVFGHGFQNAGTPENLQIYARGQGASSFSLITQDGALSAAVYQEKQDLWVEGFSPLGTWDVYGSFIGNGPVLVRNTASGGVTRLHYDESLRDDKSLGGLKLNGTGRVAPIYHIESLSYD